MEDFNDEVVEQYEEFNDLKDESELAELEEKQDTIDANTEEDDPQDVLESVFNEIIDIDKAIDSNLEDIKKIYSNISGLINLRDKWSERIKQIINKNV